MKKISKGMLMTALICGAVYLGNIPVYANELQEFSLDEYVVTAARTETKLVDTPANISVVDAQTIEERHYQDVSEVLKDVPGANVLDNGDGASEKKIVLNGDERVLILVDGRRLNFAAGTMTRSGYDMNMLPDVGLIERVEVLKGAGGALYGSDAVGGVVNIITKKADRTFGKVSIASGSMGAKDYKAVYTFKEDKTAVNVAASKYEQDYYKYKDAKLDSTKKWLGSSNFEEKKVSLSIEQNLNTNCNIAFGYDYSKFDGFSAWDVRSSGSRIDKKTENIFIKYDWILNNNDTGFVQYYHNELDYNNSGNITEKTDGVDLQQVLTIGKNNKLVVGSSWRESDVDNEASNYKEGVDSVAIFINDTWEFVPTWTLNAGVRYDDHSVVGDETTLSAGLNKKFDDDSHAYISWGQVFRTPTTDDLYWYQYYGEDYGGMYGNPNLKPETGDTWTIGYQSKLGKATNIGLNYFESDLEDAIDWVYNYGSGYFMEGFVRNVKEQKKRGLELSINHQLNDNVGLVASYTYLKVENKEDGSFVRDLNCIPNMFKAGINYNDGKWSTDMMFRYATGGATNIYNGAYGPAQAYVKNSYFTADLAVTYKATKDLTLYAKGYNLFNEAYAEQAGTNLNGSYLYPAQSRRFIVGAEYKF